MADELLSQEEIEALMAGVAAGGGADAGQAEEAPPAKKGKKGAKSEPDAQAVGEVAADEVAEPAVDDTADLAAEADAMMANAIPEPVPDSVPEISVRTQDDSVVRPVQFAPLSPVHDPGSRSGMELILDVQVQIAVELGRTTMQVREVLGLGPGAVVELDKHAGEPVEVVVNNKIVARGEVVVIDENFGVRITEIVNGRGREVDLQAA